MESNKLIHFVLLIIFQAHIFDINIFTKQEDYFQNQKYYCLQSLSFLIFPIFSCIHKKFAHVHIFLFFMK